MISPVNILQFLSIPMEEEIILKEADSSPVVVNG